MTQTVQVTDEQVAAARLRVTVDRKLGRESDPLVAEVAKARSAAEFNKRHADSDPR